MARLDMTTEADLARRAFGAYPCALHATSRDGRRHAVEVLQPPGFSADGPDAKTVLEKFGRITANRLSPPARDRIVEAVMTLDKAKTCEQLMRAVASRAEAAAALD
jgi:2-methylcitrate dehydratase PrpD